MPGLAARNQGHGVQLVEGLLDNVAQLPLTNIPQPEYSPFLPITPWSSPSFAEARLNTAAEPTSMSSDDLIPRGDYSSNLPGTLTFVGLRALDPLLQYSILAHGTGTRLITALRGSVVPNNASPAQTGVALLDDLQLSPYRLVLFGMGVGSAVKQIVWRLFLGKEPLGPGPSALVAVFNSVINGLNALFFLTAAMSPAASSGEGPSTPSYPPHQLVIGGGLYVVGILAELLSEVQRKMFKDKPENKGKPCTSGLWSIVRHPNYMGYTLWRAGFALAGGGWIWGAIAGGFFFWDFATRAIPVLDEYCNNRYADMWHDYKAQTPYILVPFAY